MHQKWITNEDSEGRQAANKVGNSPKVTEPMKPMRKRPMSSLAAERAAAMTSFSKGAAE